MGKRIYRIAGTKVKVKVLIVKVKVALQDVTGGRITSNEYNISSKSESTNESESCKFDNSNVVQSESWHIPVQPLTSGFRIHWAQSGRTLSLNLY